LAFLGILITAALFLRAYQRLFLGPPTKTGVADLTATETIAIAPLMVLAVVLGLFPRFLLDVVEPAARVLGTLVSR
jgi:NADH-quinone oxidoreductase subunit M